MAQFTLIGKDAIDADRLRRDDDGGALRVPAACAPEAAAGGDAEPVGLAARLEGSEGAALCPVGGDTPGFAEDATRRVRDATPLVARR